MGGLSLHEGKNKPKAKRLVDVIFTGEVVLKENDSGIQELHAKVLPVFVEGLSGAFSHAHKPNTTTTHGVNAPYKLWTRSTTEANLQAIKSKLIDTAAKEKMITSMERALEAIIVKQQGASIGKTYSVNNTNGR